MKLLTQNDIGLISGLKTPKFLATVNSSNIPNVVPIISLTAVSEDILIFGELMIQKTRVNLEENFKVAVLIFSENFDLLIIRGDFQGFQKSGKYLEILNENPFYRYNAYLGVSRAGVIKVREVVSRDTLSSFKMLKDYLFTKIICLFLMKFLGKKSTTGYNNKIPHQVNEKFKRLKAVKVFSFIGENGYPAIITAMSMLPINNSKLVFCASDNISNLAQINLNSIVASSVITKEPVSYQIKGEWKGVKKCFGLAVGLVEVREVYSACPPRPGERII